jgi:hypothetical protein
MSKAAERFVGAILAGEPPQMINEMARQVIEKKTRKALKRRQGDWMAREDFPDGHSGQSEEETSLEEVSRKEVETPSAFSKRLMSNGGRATIPRDLKTAG